MRSPVPTHRFSCIILGAVVLAASMLFLVAPDAAQAAHTQDRLLPGESLTAGQYLESEDGAYRLTMQYDGNVVLRRTIDNSPYWEAETNGNVGAKARMQYDGNFVVYAQDGGVLFNARTNDPSYDQSPLKVSNPGELSWRFDSDCNDCRSVVAQSAPPRDPNLFKNSQFRSFDRQGPVNVTCRRDGQSRGPCDGGRYFSDNWIGKLTKPGSEATFERLNGQSGGVRVNLSTVAGDFIYLRQYVPGIQQFSGKNLYMRIELDGASEALHYDVYVNARFNKNDALGVGRINVPVTSRRPLPDEPTVIYHAFQVPDLDDVTLALDERNSLETAFRIYTATGVTASVRVKSITLHESHEFDESVWNE